ncbi:hypothetical protein [Streptomyces sp. NPDC005799]
MNRFVLGLVFGGCAYAIAWAAGADQYVTVTAALLTALIVWIAGAAR